MIKSLFFNQIKKILSDAQTLSEVEEKLNGKVLEAKKCGQKIGIVVGKVSPSLRNESIEINKSILAENTLKIAKLVEKDKVAVFSSAVIPSSLEGKFPPTDFYRVFNDFVKKSVEMLFTTPGWQNSRGASNEVLIAKNKGIPIFHYSNGSLAKEV